MSEIKKKSWAFIKANQDFIKLQTYSGYHNFLPDPQGPVYYLTSIHQDRELGKALLDCLLSSRLVDLDDEEFFSFEHAMQRYKAWVATTMEKYGYKTKQALFKKMKSCGVECEDGIITIRPSNHVKLEAWSGDGIREEDYVKIPFDSPPEEIGAAIRLALSRCKGMGVS